MNHFALNKRSFALPASRVLLRPAAGVVLAAMTSFVVAPAPTLAQATRTPDIAARTGPTDSTGTSGPRLPDPTGPYNPNPSEPMSKTRSGPAGNPIPPDLVASQGQQIASYLNLVVGSERTNAEVDNGPGRVASGRSVTAETSMSRQQAELPHAQSALRSMIQTLKRNDKWVPGIDTALDNMVEQSNLEPKAKKQFLNWVNANGGARAVMEAASRQRIRSLESENTLPARTLATNAEQRSPFIVTSQVDSAEVIALWSVGRCLVFGGLALAGMASGIGAAAGLAAVGAMLTYCPIND